MFTGLTRDMGTLLSAQRKGHVVRIAIESGLTSELDSGSSVSVDGVCLTVVAVNTSSFTVEATGETLERTTFERWRGRRKVNLERPLTASQPMDGHLVAGHVDGIATLVAKRTKGHGIWMDFRPPSELMRYIAPQGSVALDGVSLTVASVSLDSFSVSTIPLTLEKTTLGLKRVGDYLNIEIDIVARYVERLMARGVHHE